MGDKAKAASPPADAQNPTTEEAAPPPLPELSREQLLELLDKHADDPDFRKEARSRRWVGGIAGEIAQHQKQQAEFQAAQAAIEKTHADMRQLATDDPLAFASKWLNADDVKSIADREAGLRTTTRKEFAEDIGAALRDLPEFNELTAQDVEALSKEITGVPDDKLLGVFVKKATDLVADKRGEKRAEARLEARIAEERKVWEKERAVEKAKGRSAPSLKAPTSNASDDAEPDWRKNPKEFDEWFNRKYRGNRYPVAS